MEVVDVVGKEGNKEWHNDGSGGEEKEKAFPLYGIVVGEELEEDGTEGEEDHREGRVVVQFLFRGERLVQVIVNLF